MPCVCSACARVSAALRVAALHCAVLRCAHHAFISFHFISFHFISFHFISFHFISFHFISFHFISFHFISFHFISFHFISFHFISFHFISFHFISFHFISFHFISFHFISFHFISFVSLSPHSTARASTERDESHDTALAPLSLLKHVHGAHCLLFSPPILVTGWWLGLSALFSVSSSSSSPTSSVFLSVFLSVFVFVCCTVPAGWLFPVLAIPSPIPGGVYRDLTGQATVVFVTMRAFDKAGSVPRPIMTPVYRELIGRVLTVILSLFQYTEKLRSLYTSFFYASWHAPVVDSAAMRTVYVVTTAASQSFEAIYVGTPLFLSIPGVNAITVLSAASGSHCSVAVSPEEYRIVWIF